MSWFRWRTHCVCVLVSLSAFCSFATADIYEWNASTGGDFATAGNWTPSGVPGIGDRARFDLGTSGYTVDISGSRQVDRLIVLNDTVTFNVTGQLGLDGATQNSYIMIGDDGSQPTVSITGGGTFGSANGFHLAWDINSIATVSILNGTVMSGYEFNVGRRGRGTLNIAENGVVNSGKSIIGSYTGAIGRVVMDGGTWYYSNVVNPELGPPAYGTLCIGWDGVGYLTASNGATLSQGDLTKSVYLGYVSGYGEVLLEDSGTTWTAGDLVRVGCEGTGVVTIRDGAEMSCQNMYVAAQASSAGSVFVDGGELSLAGKLFVGGNDTSAGGQGMMLIRNGAAVSIADLLTVWENGLLHLQDGLLKAGKIDTTAGGFAWTGGELWITGADGLVIGGDEDIQSVGLTNSKTLTVDNVLAISGGGMLALESMGSLSCAELVLDGGTVSTTTVFNVDDVNTLRGHGVANAKISGGSSAMIVADEALVLGEADSKDGFNFDGTLNVETYDVTLLDSNRARLGEQTNIGQGGKLTGVNGLRLDTGDTLTANSDCMVQGDFLNNEGVVEGPTDAGEFLVFDDNVSGSGSYSGNIEFRQGFSPGNSPGVVSFGEGNANFGADSTLTMEINGLTSGEYDQLVDLSNLDFNGTLKVVFDYAAAEGDSFTLLDFATFSGSFDRVGVSGLDPSLMLDLSDLATTGIATISLACPTCPGDLNGDSLVDGRDIQDFVECLLHGTSGSSNCACGASDGEPPVDVDDVEAFVDRLLNLPPPC